MTRVIALQRGHDGTTVREIGEQFDVPDERLKDGTTWFVPVDQAPEPKPADRNANPPGAGPKKGSKVQAPEEPGSGF